MLRRSPVVGPAGVELIARATNAASLASRHCTAMPRQRRYANDMRLRGTTQPNSVWSDDFVPDRLVDGRTLKVLR